MLLVQNQPFDIPLLDSSPYIMWPSIRHIVPKLRALRCKQTKVHFFEKFLKRGYLAKISHSQYSSQTHCPTWCGQVSDILFQDCGRYGAYRQKNALSDRRRQRTYLLKYTFHQVIKIECIMVPYESPNFSEHINILFDLDIYNIKAKKNKNLD